MKTVSWILRQANKNGKEDAVMEDGVLDDTPVGKMTSKDETISRQKKMMNNNQQIPRKKNIRSKMEMARDAALGNNNNNKRKKRRRNNSNSAAAVTTTAKDTTKTTTQNPWKRSNANY